MNRYLDQMLAGFGLFANGWLDSPTQANMRQTLYRLRKLIPAYFLQR